MKNSLFVLTVGTLLVTGCSAAFKTAETPDDVYYSYGPKAIPVQEEIQENDAYTSYWENADDSYLRMKVQNRDKWASLDDVNYWNSNPTNMWNAGINSFAYNSWYNPFAPTSYYNNWNNPYCWNRPVVFVNKFPAGTAAVTPRPGYNKAGFGNSLFDRSNNMSTIFSKTGQTQSGYGSRQLFRTIFGTSSSEANGNSNSNSAWARPSRLFESSGSSNSSSSGGSSRSSGSSSSSSGSSSSGGGGSRGGRGGN
jgi:hypothetical protein